MVSPIVSERIGRDHGSGLVLLGMERRELFPIIHRVNPCWVDDL